MDFLAHNRSGGAGRRGAAAILAAIAVVILSIIIVPSASAASNGAMAWGDNSFGELGNGTTTGTDVPVAVSELSGITAVGAGDAYSLALLNDGTVRSWGAGSNGVLGDASEANSDVPVSVTGLSGVTAIAAGEENDLALLSNGTVMAWGSNAGGALGDGKTEKEQESSDVPVAVSGLSGVTAIAAGSASSLALLSNGTVMAWGNFVPGVESDVPVAVSGLSGVIAIAAGRAFNLALLSNGTVMAWGSNSLGQLGDGTTENSSTPVAVSGLSGVTAISAGGEDSFAVLGGHTVMAWGWNESGQLGDGTTKGPEFCGRSTGELACSRTPVAVSGLAGATAVSAGVVDSLALLSDGTIMAWGDNTFGQLGNGTTKGSDVPVAVTGLAGVQGVAAGQGHSLSFESPIPSVGGLNPNNGPASGGTSVTITGLNLTGATTVNFGSTSAASFTVNSDTSITAVSPAGTGTVHVTVSTPEGSSTTGVADEFSYAPAVTNLMPDLGPASGGTSVTITGTNFTEATAVKFGSANATSFTVDSATSVTAVAPAGTGTVDVTVTTPGGTSPISPADVFSYAPAVTTVNPNVGPASGGTSVTITGTNFSGTTAVNFGSTSATSFTVNSETSITAAAPAGSGTVDVTVTTPGGTSPSGSADRFSYAPLPTITELNPKTGQEMGGTSVTITGTGFTGATAVDFGLNSALSYTVNSGTSITAVAPAGTGTVDVTVTTPGGTNATGTADQFTYVLLPPPTVAKLKPRVGAIAGGTTVVITGTSFTGAEAVMFGASPAASFTVNSASMITAVSPAEADGKVNVTVTTPSGTSAVSKADLFTVAPTVTNVSPNAGPVAGGTVVTVAGTGFALGTTATVFKLVKAKTPAVKATGVNCPSTTECTMVAPLHAAGTVDVKATVNKATSPKNAPADQFTYE
jgi:alpha-tubulin suppressor-like RCC1 family protein